MLGASLELLGGVLVAWAVAFSFASSPPEVSAEHRWAGAQVTDPEQCARMDARAYSRFERGLARVGVRDAGWGDRARRCPQAPYTVALSVVARWMTLETLPTTLDAESVSTFRAERAERRAWALARLGEVFLELGRSAAPMPGELLRLEAEINTSVGRLDAASEALARGEAAGQIARVDARWLRGVMGLLAHDARGGLAALGDPYGHRDAHHDRASVPLNYVRALLLDRLGDREGARSAMTRAHADDRDQQAFRSLLRVLPFHEAMYFRALTLQHTARVHALTARLWALYLACPEVAPPERALARRHADSLAPRPTFVD